MDIDGSSSPTNPPDDLAVIEDGPPAGYFTDYTKHTTELVLRIRDKRKVLKTTNFFVTVSFPAL
jgi:hypothetical protein